MTSILEYKRPRARFARSINVERDAGTAAVDGYLPVGRAVDAINRLTSSLDGDDAEVAISITGPYGSGKSSLAVVLDALLGPADDPARRSAEELLLHTAPESLERLRSARERLGADRSGFIRAVVTAQREPITETVVRALLHGARRFNALDREKPALRKAVRSLREIQRSSSRPDARTLRLLVADLGSVAPILLLIDEFGKNLEAFADSHSDSDLFLLQELAEWSRGSGRLPLAIVTMQHMAFDEYADSASTGQRREWAKVQGRFEDVPFVDSPAQTRVLIAAAFEAPSPGLAEAQTAWADREVGRLRELGLSELASNPAVLATCWPLHPIALAALPELCERYGQNERTLFSFLAGPGPHGVLTFLSDNAWADGEKLPVVRLDRLYDYFIEAAANLVSISSNASRWMEIDTRVRDAVGISDAARRVLKAVGLLNLVSAGGTLRASPAIVSYVAADGLEGSRDGSEVVERLRDLESAGLVTFRDFADEYRVWHGSDFDLRSAIDQARRRLRDVPSADILNRVLQLEPLVAARHSHETGTLRAFDRAWVEPDVESIEPLGAADRADGLALYVLGSPAPTSSVGRSASEKPVVFVTTSDPDHLVEAAREVAAIDDILDSTQELTDDWVARRELHERRVEAYAELERSFHDAYGPGRAEWHASRPGRRRRWSALTAPSASGVVSQCCDAWYDRTPVIRNDLINRHELSSQAAKARRVVLEAMVSSSNQATLGIEGYGPDYTLYLSLLAEHGLHRQVAEDDWGFTAPHAKGTLHPVWTALNDLIAEANADRRRASDIYEALSGPPFGLREGVAPVVLVAALIVLSEEVALYEHGTFRPVLTEDLLERLLRNPDNFKLKHYALRRGTRSEFLTLLAEDLGVPATRGIRSGRVGSVLAIVSTLVSLVNGLPDHVKRTRQLSPDALAVRRALVTATEPDELLFKEIPSALGFAPISATKDYETSSLKALSAQLKEVLSELRFAYPRLLDEVREALRDHVGPTCSPLREGLAARAREMEGRIIDPTVAKLAAAFAAEIPDEESWLAYVAMNVTGEPPESWSDDDRRRFFVTIADAGGTFRRIHALNADLEARGEGFDAYRHVLTRSDGAEVIHVQPVGAEARAAAGEIASTAATQLMDELQVDRSEARALLATLLLEEGLAAHEIRSDLPDAYEGAQRQRKVEP